MRGGKRRTILRPTSSSSPVKLLDQNRWQEKRLIQFQVHFLQMLVFLNLPFLK